MNVKKILTRTLDHIALSADLLVTENDMPKLSIDDATPPFPIVAGGALWADTINSKLFAFGGYFPESTPVPFQTWSMYESSSGSRSWKTETVQGDTMSYVAHGMAAIAQDAGVGYYLGGYLDEGTIPGWNTERMYTSSLVSFDMVAGNYVNATGPDGMGRGEGLMIFMPASTAGILVYFGGLIQDWETGTVDAVSSNCSNLG
jgi:hypothetical protein